MTEDSVLDLIAQTLGIDRAEVSDTSDMSNTRKWDSLRQIMLMTELETQYGIVLSDQEMLETISVAQIRSVLGRHGVL